MIRWLFCLCFFPIFDHSAFPPSQVSTNPAGLYQPGTPTLISGWGEMDPKKPEQDEPGRAPAILRAASIPLIEWNACKNANFLYQEMVTETMTCAGYMTGRGRREGRREGKGEGENEEEYKEEAEE